MVYLTVKQYNYLIQFMSNPTLGVEEIPETRYKRQLIYEDEPYNNSPTDKYYVEPKKYFIHDDVLLKEDIFYINKTIHPEKPDHKRYIMGVRYSELREKLKFYESSLSDIWNGILKRIQANIIINIFSKEMEQIYNEPEPNPADLKKKILEVKSKLKNLYDEQLKPEKLDPKYSFKTEEKALKEKWNKATDDRGNTYRKKNEGEYSYNRADAETDELVKQFIFLFSNDNNFKRKIINEIKIRFFKK